MKPVPKNETWFKTVTYTLFVVNILASCGYLLPLGWPPSNRDAPGVVHLVHGVDVRSLVNLLFIYRTDPGKNLLLFWGGLRSDCPIFIPTNRGIFL